MKGRFHRPLLRLLACGALLAGTSFAARSSEARLVTFKRFAPVEGCNGGSCQTPGGLILNCPTSGGPTCGSGTICGCQCGQLPNSGVWASANICGSVN